jgi:hypothetical protein
MRNTGDPDATRRARMPRAARLASGKSRVMPQDGVTITAGAEVSRIDLASVLARRPADGESIGGGMPRAVSGGAQAVATESGKARTVALSDGTHIVFAAAEPPERVEPA